MLKIENLLEHDMDAVSASVAVPANDRIVILQDIVDGEVATCSARYRDGGWIGVFTNTDIGPSLSEQAIWMESRLFPASAAANSYSQDSKAPL